MPGYPNKALKLISPEFVFNQKLPDSEILWQSRNDRLAHSKRVIIAAMKRSLRNKPKV
jgi:hypothetical protein